MICLFNVNHMHVLELSLQRIHIVELTIDTLRQAADDQTEIGPWLRRLNEKLARAKEDYENYKREIRECCDQCARLCVDYHL